MRRIYIFLVLALQVSFAFYDTVTVQGNAYLYGATDHSGIRVEFKCIAPIPDHYTTRTDSTGHYSKDIPTGIYKIIFSKPRYKTDSIVDCMIFSPITLPEITLMEFFSGPVYDTLPVDTYNVEDDLYVPSDDTLVINPGTVLRFADSVEFIVYGTLIVNGGDSISVIFTKKPGTSGWKGIVTNPILHPDYSGKIKLDGCLIEYASDCAIRLNEHYSLEMRNCEIRYCGSAVISDGAKVNIERTNIHNCNGDNVLWIHLGRFTRHNLIKKCTIYNNNPRDNLIVLYVSDCYLSFENCAIYNNTIPGSALYTIYGSKLLVANCVFYNNVCRLDTSYFPIVSTRSILLNTIIANNDGIGIDGRMYAFNNDFWNNSRGDFGPNVRPWMGVNVIVNANGDSCDAYENIRFDPMFVNPAAGDFHLTASSHCIDAGVGSIYLYGTRYHAPTDDIDDGPRPAGSSWDIGLDEFNSTYITEFVKPAESKLTVYPNPFNSSCVIYAPSNAVVEIYDLNGKLVHKASTTTGKYVWNPHKNVSSGVYIVRAFAKGRMLTTRAVLIK